MLYLTTRDNKNAHTAHKTLCTDYALDGGMFVPYKLPKLDDAQLNDTVCGSFGDVIARILNLFFSVRLSGWGVDLQIGRNPVSLVSMNRKIVVAELWKNPGAGIDHLIESLYNCVAVNEGHSEKPTIWARTAIRIAILFGLYAQISGDVEENPAIDISVNMQDITELTAAYYARAMGLPIGKIICCCDAGDSFWDLLHAGGFNTRNTQSPQLKAAEVLACESLGHIQSQYLASVADRRGTYTLSEEDFAILSQDIYPVAISSDRVDSVISSVRRSSGYSIDPTAAIAYGGLQDYRAQTGESCVTLILSQYTPDNV